MTLREFMKDYEGFNWANGEIAVFDQRRGQKVLFTVGGSYENIAEEKGFFEQKVYDWTHTEKTMFIIL